MLENHEGREMKIEDLNKKKHLRPDHQMFDEVTIRTIPRFKESELSGDEWRISAVIEFKCKGRVMHERCLRDVETALDFAKSEYHVACDNGRQYANYEARYCDQEGCLNEPTEFFKVKKQYNREGDISRHQFEQYRSFCKRHSTRGDCGLEDADDNYERIAIG